MKGIFKSLVIIVLLFMVLLPLTVSSDKNKSIITPGENVDSGKNQSEIEIIVNESEDPNIIKQEFVDF